MLVSRIPIPNFQGTSLIFAKSVFDGASVTVQGTFTFSVSLKKHSDMLRISTCTCVTQHVLVRMCGCLFGGRKGWFVLHLDLFLKNVSSVNLQLPLLSGAYAENIGKVEKTFTCPTNSSEVMRFSNLFFTHVVDI